jgi:Dolichyl-phosphate-mannose-protein mannosyltransferase
VLLWRLALVALGGACVGVWHISVLWLYRDTPSVLAGWLAAVFVLVAVARKLARGVPSARRTALMRAFARLDRTGFVFVAFLLLLLLVFHVSFQRAASDGRSYYVQLRSLVMDWDLDLSNDEATFGGRGANKYAFGAPVLWSPFYVLCHLWLRGLNLMGGTWTTDGYTYPYQRAVGLATLLYGFLGLVLIYRVLRRYFSRPISLLSTLGICSTTFLFWYLTADNSMVHGASMFATTLFLFLWHRFRDQPTPRRWLWLGASAGLMGYVRWQDGVFAIVPVADLLWASWQARTGPAAGRLQAAAGDLVRFGAAAFLTFSPQLLFWRAVYGQWVHLPTQEHGFHPGLIPPFIVDVLFSANRGLLTTTPVLTLALIGLVLFTRRHWRVGAALAAGLVAQIWVNGAVEIWWGGVGYGARRFANSMLVFAVGLAGLLSAMERFPLVAPAMILAGLLVYNVVYMMGLKDGSLPSGEGVTFPTVVGQLYERLGNPFSLPVGAYVAWRYDVPITAYDQLRGRTYNNITIDFGTLDDERFIGHGWSGREQGPRFPFRWSDRITSTVLVPLTANIDDYRLELQWEPLPGPGLPPQVVTVQINDADLADIKLQPGLHTDELGIPHRMLRQNLNLLRFRYAWARSPKDLGLSEDGRTLAVRFVTIRLTRLLGSGAAPPP